MNILRLAILVIFYLVQPVMADTKPVDKKTPAVMAKAVPPAKKDVKKAKAPAKAKKPAGFVIGKNIKVGMPLEEAIKLLGIPRSIKVERGTESRLDSIAIAYANHGIVLHTLNDKKRIEALEILPQFKGSFVAGVKMGEKVTTMIEKYGVPQSMNAGMAKYPERGLYFSLKKNAVVAAHIFAKNSKLLSHQLFKSRR